MEKKSRKGFALILVGVVVLFAGGVLVFAHAGGGHGRRLSAASGAPHRLNDIDVIRRLT